MTSLSPLYDLLLLAGLIGYTAWWSFDLWRGTRVRRWTLGLHIAVYCLAALWVWSTSLVEIVSAGAPVLSGLLWLLVLPALFYLITRSGLRYGRRRIVVYRFRAQSWRYRGPASIAFFWLVLYLVRFGLEDGLIGGFSVLFPTGQLPHGAPPDGLPLLVFAPVVFVVGCLYLLSFGFLLGVTLAVWGHHRRAIRTAGMSDLPSGEERTPFEGPSQRSPAAPVSDRSISAQHEGGLANSASNGKVQGPSGHSIRGMRGSLPPGEVPVRSTTSRYCTRCGSRFEREGRLCPRCGAPRPG